MSKVYQMITDQIIKRLEEGTVPWHKPWKTAGGPRNLQSKRPYRGMNAFQLVIQPFSSPYWTTYKAAEKMGGQVRKGEKGTTVIFWKVGEPREVEQEDGSYAMKRSFMLRYYTVFNVEQVEWNDEAQIKIDKLNAELKQIDFKPIEAAEAVLDEMQNPPAFVSGDSACYRPTFDEVGLPRKDSFESVEAYYTTAFHEVGHSTGHESRLGRVKDWNMFGSDPYAKEELVAEMTAAFIAGSVGLDVDPGEQTSAYIANWIKKFESDPKILISAASQAQKAADYIMNNSYEQEQPDERES